ncbi:MAG: hypothetical protein KGY45_02685 [Hadesarchaea archaeon]|nr:hypothetical protein [Hadesarchaea archaeon]
MREEGISQKVIIITIIVIIAAASAGLFLLNEISVSSNDTSFTSPNYEVIGSVVSIADGDTITVIIENIVSDIDPEGEVEVGNSEEVRFGGGVDAPETGPNSEVGGEEATEFIDNYLFSGMNVYLDLDNRAEGGSTGRPYRGAYERLIAVVYLKYGENKWINLNAKLLRWGENNYPNNDWLEYDYIDSEFDGHIWLENGYPYI